MQPLQGKNWFLLASSQPQGGAPLTLGYYMQPLWSKNPNRRYSFAGRPSFFGGLGPGQAAPRDRAHGRALYVASLLDLAGTKVAVVQKRAVAKDYLDIDRLLQHGTGLPAAFAAGRIVYGRSFNPMITLKALSSYDRLIQYPIV